MEKHGNKWRKVIEIKGKRYRVACEGSLPKRAALLALNREIDKLIRASKSGSPTIPKLFEAVSCILQKQRLTRHYELSSVY